MSRKLSELFNRNLVIVFFYRRDWCCTQLPARLTLVLTVHFTQNWGSLGSLGSCSASSGLWSNETGAAVTEEIVESAVPGKSRFVLVRTRNEPADCPALRPDGPRSGRSAPVGRTVRACAEQIRVPSFVLRLLAKIAG
jgi:hypothetical protein